MVFWDFCTRVRRLIGSPLDEEPHTGCVEQRCQKPGSSANELEGELFTVLPSGDELNLERSDWALQPVALLLSIQLPRFQLR